MTRTRRDEFPDPDVFAANKEIREQFENVLTGLRKVCYNNQVTCDKLSKFRGFISEPPNNAEASLPVFVRTRLSHVQNKHFCVLNTLSMIVQRYWDFLFYHDRFYYVYSIRYDLDFLEAIVEKGLDAFELVGEKFPGYYLREKV